MARSIHIHVRDGTAIGVQRLILRPTSTIIVIGALGAGVGRHETVSELAERKQGSAAALIDRGDFQCSICNFRLVQVCYHRSRAFRVFRKTLIAAMRWLSYCQGIDGRFDAAAVVECRDCIRHMKTRLKAQSPVFRWLNRWANPFFHAWRDRLVTTLERAEAQRFARESCRRNIPGGLRP